MARPRKPLALKLLEGTLRKDRDGDLNSRVQPDGLPEPVLPLDGEALEHWNRVVPLLTDLGVATAADSEALSLLSTHWQALCMTQRMIAVEPAHKDARVSYLGYVAAWERLAAKFGLTPVDREKLRVEKPDSDELERKFG